MFVNNGSVIKNTTTGTSFFAVGIGYGGVAFNNNGSVNIQNGNLSLGDGGDSLNGSFTVAAGSVVDFTNGLFFVNGNQALSGGGMERVSGGTVTFNNSTDTLGGGNMFAITSGALGGTNTFSGAGTVNWSGGIIGAQLKLSSTVALNINGANDKLLHLGAITSSGPGTWTGTGHVLFGFGSAFTNNGTFTIQNDSFVDNDGSYNGYDYPSPLFVNNGSVIKNTTTGTTAFSVGLGYGGVAFNNNGIVDLRTGTLAINGSYILSGSPQLKLVLGGVNPGTQFSQETFAGPAALGGTLSVTLANGFSPTNGQSFAVVTYGSESGQFASQQLPALPSGLAWQITYGATAVTLNVVRATVITDATRLANGHFQFSLSGPSATSALIQASTNLVNWTSLQTNTPFSGLLLFDDAQTVGYPVRFYRVLLLP